MDSSKLHITRRTLEESGRTKTELEETNNEHRHLQDGTGASMVKEAPGSVPGAFPHSPLRYPGGKSHAIRAILPWIPESETKLFSPFLGGASIELASTLRMNVYASDFFEQLMIFWKILLTQPERLVERVLRYYPLSQTEFYEKQKCILLIDDEVEIPAIFFTLNRSSFSGLTLSGGYYPGRFTDSSIARLGDFSVKNFQVECSDYRDSIPKHAESFMYCDPPYSNGQALYGVRGVAQKEFDHESLAEMLHYRDRWLLSYNDCEAIRRLYRHYLIIPLEWKYGMGKSKSSNEILIMSNDLKNLDKKRHHELW
jgi:DNA adenine methylase